MPDSESRARRGKPGIPGIAGGPKGPQGVVVGPKIDPDLVIVPRKKILRPGDLFVAEISFSGLSRQVDDDGGPDDQGAWLVRDPGASSAYIALTLAAQNIAEEAFYERDHNLEDEGQDDSFSLPARSRLSGLSVLAFAVPQGYPPIPYSIGGILATLLDLPLNVVPVATPPSDRPRYKLPFWFEDIVIDFRPPDDHLQPGQWLLNKARVQRIEDQSENIPVAIAAVAPTRLNVGEEIGVRERDPFADHSAGTMIGRIGAGGAPITQVVKPGDRLVIDDLIDDISIQNEVVLKARLRKPRAGETAIELPYRLILSPHNLSAFVHAIAAAPPRVFVPNADDLAAPSPRIDVWHTRLGTRIEKPDAATIVTEEDHRLRTVRAVWARAATEDSGDPPSEQQFRPQSNGTPDDDYPANDDYPADDDEPFMMSLTPRDRFEIVHLSSNADVREHPEAIHVTKLMLSSLGAWTDLRGSWEPPKNFNVEEWKNRGTVARDHYVRVVYKGYLFPFGHRASLIKVTERKFHPTISGNPAILRQRYLIMVRQPVLDYQDGLIHDGKRLDLSFPFRTVRIKTTVTPSLEPPDESYYGSDPAPDISRARELFVPRVSGKDFLFTLVAEDVEANRVEFSMPLLFVINTLADSASDLPSDIAARFRDGWSTQPARGGTTMQGQRTAFAVANKPGDTTFEARRFTFGAVLLTPSELGKLEDDRPCFYPTLDSADVILPAAKAFSGNDETTKVAFDDKYLEIGLSGPEGTPSHNPSHANKGELFLRLPDGLGFDIGSNGDRSGGFMRPNIDVTGLSRVTGLVGGDPATLRDGQFNPADFFPNTAKLFGVVPLGDLIPSVPNLDAKDLVPRFITEAFSAVESMISDIMGLIARLTTLRTQIDATEAALRAQVQTLIDDIQGDLTNIGSAIGNLMDGDLSDQDRQDLIDSLGTFRGHLRDAETLVNGLPAEVPAEVRQAVQTSLGRFFRDLGTGVEGGAAALEKLSSFFDALSDALKLPEELRFRFAWKPDLQNWPDADVNKAIFVARPASGPAATLSIEAQIDAKTNLHPEPRAEVAARLHNFSLRLIGEACFLILHFDKLEFSASTETKPDVNVEFRDIEFAGPLAFVEALRDLIPLDGFSDPPALDVTEEGIAASFSLALPNIAFGVFSLQNLSLGAGFSIPFVGEHPLSVRFNFCERHEPFLLTVSMFGGGGFFAITIDPGGVQILEAAFEFGASVSIDLGVASGGVSVMAGIYFKMEDDAAELTGYLRITGEVDVLGLISVCIELYMELRYELATEKCVGKATLSIEVEVAFFSETVQITCERKFAGSNGDPTFSQLMAPQDDWSPWDDYCEAFATEEVA